MNFFAILIFLLAGGMFLVLHRIPLGEIGPKFYRLVTIIFLAGCGIVLLTMSPGSRLEWIQFSLILGLLATGVAFVVNLPEEPSRFSFVLYGVISLAIVTMIITFSITPHLSSATSRFPWYVVGIQFLLSAAILGSIVDSMICGHWYLVNTGLSLNPIRSISQTLTLSILAKLAVSSIILFYLWFSAQHIFDRLVFTLPLLFWVRFLIGLGGGLLFNWMSWKTLEYDNTQAATGILYGCITWIILGEFSGFYLTLQTGVPL